MDPIKEKLSPSSFWNLADHWFRLLEMALILGTLGYLKIKTGNLAVVGIYWISWFVLYWWFLEIGEWLAKSYSHNKSVKRKLVVWCISMGTIMIFYYGITETTQWIIQQQI
jgi:hypothetical protein